MQVDTRQQLSPDFLGSRKTFSPAERIRSVLFPFRFAGAARVVLRGWAGFGLLGTTGAILRRRDGEWSASRYIRTIL